LSKPFLARRNKREIFALPNDTDGIVVDIRGVKVKSRGV
jgi:hypothetical protein